MKTFTVFFVIATVVLIGNASAGSLEEMKAKMMETAKECMAEHKITEDTFNKIKNKEVVMTPEAKCFKACVMQNVGIMGQDNKLNKAGIIEKIQPFFGDKPDKMALAEQIIDKCNQHSETDKCEAAGKMCQCLFTSVEGAEFKELM